MNKLVSKFLLFVGLVFSPLIVFAEESKPWDFLRPVSDFALSLDNIAKIGVLLFALVLCTVSILAYFKVKSKKMLIVASAFSLFALKYVLVVLDVFLSPGLFFSEPSQNFVELIVFVLLFWAIFKKQGA